MTAPTQRPAPPTCCDEPGCAHAPRETVRVPPEDPAVVYLRTRRESLDLRERAEAAEARRRAQWDALSPEARAAVWIALGEAT